MHDKYAGMTMNEMLFTAGISKEFDASLMQKDITQAVKLLTEAEIFDRTRAEEYVDSLLLEPERFTVGNDGPYWGFKDDCIKRFVAEMNRLGVPISFPAELNLHKKLPDGMLSAILTILDGCDDEHQQLLLLDYLGWVKGPIDAGPIVALYEKARPGGQVRFHITEMFNSRQFNGLENWLPDILARDGMIQSDIGYLPLVLARLSDSDQTRQILRNTFPQSPIRVALALAICGKRDDASFLKSHLSEFKNWEQSKIEHAISTILHRYGAP